jgi:hypothetical protein
LYPAIAQLERAAGFRREDTPEQRLDKLEAVLAQGTNDLNEAVPLLADLLSITADRYPTKNRGVANHCTPLPPLYTPALFRCLMVQGVWLAGHGQYYRYNTRPSRNNPLQGAYRCLT